MGTNSCLVYSFAYGFPILPASFLGYKTECKEMNKQEKQTKSQTTVWWLPAVVTGVVKGKGDDMTLDGGHTTQYTDHIS